MPEPSAFTGSNQGHCFPPTPSQINKMLDLKYDSWNSDLPSSSIPAYWGSPTTSCEVLPSFNHEVSSVDAPVSIPYGSLEMVIKYLHVLPKFSNHLIEAEGWLRVSYKANKHPFFFSCELELNQLSVVMLAICSCLTFPAIMSFF